jgi:hypothetical protein
MTWLWLCGTVEGFVCRISYKDFIYTTVECVVGWVILKGRVLGGFEVECFSEKIPTSERTFPIGLNLGKGVIQYTYFSAHGILHWPMDLLYLALFNCVVCISHLQTWHREKHLSRM